MVHGHEIHLDVRLDDGRKPLNKRKVRILEQVRLGRPI